MNPVMERNRMTANLPSWKSAAVERGLVPFKLCISQDAIDDLVHRIERTRWPDEPPDQTAEGHWRYGTPAHWLRSLHSYWLTSFDWRRQELQLNEFEQWIARLDAVNLHFIYAPGQCAASKPLLLLHGWPGSVFEFFELIPKLTAAIPASVGQTLKSFDVIAPSLPGFGLSFRKGQPRLGLEEMADLLHHLIRDVLGYSEYFVQGGDWGSFIASAMAYRHPEAVKGIHLNLLPLRRDSMLFQEPIDAEAKRYATELDDFLRENTGYQWIQGTRPQTLAYALNDSPMGLAAWIGEKFAAWSDCNGKPESVIPFERMLANICFYWFTEAIGSSFWPYYARLHAPWFLPRGETISVPMAYCQFPKEILRPPRSLASRTYRQIIRWHEAENGGHFAALEQCEVLAREIRMSFDLIS